MGSMNAAVGSPAILLLKRETLTQLFAYQVSYQLQYLPRFEKHVCVTYWSHSSSLKTVIACIGISESGSLGATANMQVNPLECRHWYPDNRGRIDVQSFNNLVCSTVHKLSISELIALPLG